VARSAPVHAVALSASALVLLAAALHVPYPFSGDQALFAYGAQRLAAGDRLYLEFWDNKQPGIYWFYLIAARLFGPTPAGAHALEALWMLGTALASYAIARAAGAGRAAACLAPVAGVAAFYSVAGSWHLTQIEALAGLPLALAALAAAAPADTDTKRARASALIGLAAGVVAVLKLLLAIVPALMLLLYRAWVRSARLATAAGAAKQVLLPAATAGALVAGAAALQLTWRGGGPEVSWTTFVYPLAAVREIPAAPFGRLIAAVKWWAGGQLAFLPLAFVGMLSASPVRKLMLAWIGAGALIVLVQKLSWWEYHLALFFVPVGILGALGAQRLCEWRRFGRAVRAALALAAAAAAVGVWLCAQRIAEKALAADAVGGRVSARASGDEAAIEASLRAVFGPAPGIRSLYVFGDPRLLLASGGRQAIPTHGWAWELMLESQWHELPEALANARPEAVYVASLYRPLICRRAPALVRFLEAEYVAQPPDRLGGVWLLRHSLPAAGGQAPRYSCESP
jgi:hypothetical protein